jgi:tripartite ATP-independent transporter DctP family solute receptor
MINIPRRTFLVGAGALIAAPAILSLVRPAHAAVTLTLGHGAAPDNPRAIAVGKFAELVSAKTNGEVKINIAGSEQLGTDVAMLSSLRTGVLDLTANSQGAVSGVVPELAALGLAFLFEDATAAFAVLDGEFAQELAERFAAVGIVPLAWWDNGIRHVSNSKRPIHKPADLKGLKIRTPADPMTIDIFQALGAATEQIAFSELYIALQQGVVDGQENPLANIATSKVYEVTPYISLTGHQWQSTPFLISQIAMARIGEAERTALSEAAKEAGELQRGLMREADEKYLAEFKGNNALSINEVDRAAFQEATAGVAEAWKAKPFGDFVGRLIAAAGG